MGGGTVGANDDEEERDEVYGCEGGGAGAAAGIPERNGWSGCVKAEGAVGPERAGDGVREAKLLRLWSGVMAREVVGWGVRAVVRGAADEGWGVDQENEEVVRGCCW